MSRPALGILVGILIFIAAGILAVYWIAKVRQEREERKPRVAHVMMRAGRKPA